ncbi:hypothetical protein Ddye_028449 [Dipteronia dyeriana]|uniref:Uncharacterized protein n=1 Tax=Dipteronia dyeriana TaxID=168575 RepID=A0AAD9TRX5_9ROSI|nr:hypothetical protein Ddye_028449 [Dipteronia dyeriana]
MDADELERLYSALSIKELEGPVKTLDEGMKSSREPKLALFSVRKEEMPIDGDISNLGFKKFEFKIQEHKIPPLCMSEEIGLFLGKMIKEVREVVLASCREDNSHYLRIRVVVLITKPLIMSLRVDLYL